MMNRYELLLFIIISLMQNDNVTGSPEEELFQHIHDTFAPLATEQSKIRQFAVFYLSATPAFALDPPPTAFSSEQTIDGKNYLAAVRKTGAPDHTEAMILPKMSKLIENFSAESMNKPNLYLYSFYTPCCRVKLTGDPNICGDESCSGKINNFIKSQREGLNKVYIAWSRFLLMGMLPFAKQYMHILNTLLNPNTEGDKVELVVHPGRYGGGSSTSYRQDDIISCLKDKLNANKDIFMDQLKFEENIIKIVNSITWECRIEAKKDSFNCWKKSSKITSCLKMVDAVVECESSIESMNFYGPPKDPVSRKQSNSQEDVQGRYDPFPIFAKEKCKIN